MLVKYIPRHNCIKNIRTPRLIFGYNDALLLSGLSCGDTLLEDRTNFEEFTKQIQLTHLFTHDVMFSFKMGLEFA